MQKRLLMLLAAFTVGLSPMAPASAQNVVKIGQIEAQTGPASIYGFLTSQGTRMAVHQVNEAGGFEVAGKKYRLELISPDTQGNPQQALIQLKKILEQDKAHFVFGPTLSNVFNGVKDYVREYNGKILMIAPATAVHTELGKPGNDFLMRPVVFDTAPEGFGTWMVDYLKKKGVKKVAVLMQNDSFGRFAVDTYKEPFAKAGIEVQAHWFEPNTKDYSAVLAKIAVWKPDYLFPGYTDGVLYDIVQQATQIGLTKFWLVRGSLGPGMRNKDAIDEYIIYMPKYFEEAEKTDPKVAKFIKDYKEYFKVKDFPYDLAPVIYGASYDHVFMLIEAMKKAASVTDVAAIKKQLLSMTYEGLWVQKFDSVGGGIHSYEIAELRRGGQLKLHPVKPGSK
ncbi:MAG: ABC transporter substrate-binding protein [Burkholderiaceae bacterium]|nr:ABC transporter substrate-binding protein [Burkholderiaceae bacterium]